jgi:hypothetical protein
LFFILAEEREELEVLNNYRQKQLELKHRHLLQELETLKSARETTDLIPPPTTNQVSRAIGTSGIQDQSSIIDSNYKHLM